MYWKANIELRQFAHLASHDLKTPLATVANFCDEAIDEFGGQMPDEAKALIESARQRTFRMSRMIDELLSVTTSFDLMAQLQAFRVKWRSTTFGSAAAARCREAHHSSRRRQSAGRSGANSCGSANRSITFSPTP